MMNKQELTEYFIRMLQVISIPEYNNAAIIGQFIMDMLLDRADMTLSDIELTLRFMKTDIYLIGLPLSFFNTDKHSFTARRPHTEITFPYGLWIEVQGKMALEILIIQHDLIDIDRSLEHTGFLTES